MKSLAMRINSVNPIVGISLPVSPAGAFSAWRKNRPVEPNEKQADNNTCAVGIIGSILNAIVPSKTKPCNECLVDISKDTERCPHCLALQKTEAVRLRSRDAGWY